MISSSIRPSKLTAIAFGVYFLLVAADVLVIVSSKVHMNALGNVRGGRDVFLRLLPQLCLLAFYSYFFISLARNGEVRRFPMLFHSGLFALLGLGLAIPFGGLLLSALTPVSLLYRLIVLHLSTDWGYSAILVLAFLFSLLNCGLLYIVLRSK
jgi:hypothetical protein